MKKNERLLEFYFGGLEEPIRLQIERELLEDSEVLLDFLDLKRRVESAATIPATPSSFTKSKILTVARKNRKPWIFATATAVAAALILAFSFLLTPNKVEDSLPKTQHPILFDSGAEHFSASSVM